MTTIIGGAFRREVAPEAAPLVCRLNVFHLKTAKVVNEPFHLVFITVRNHNLPTPEFFQQLVNPERTVNVNPSPVIGNLDGFRTTRTCDVVTALNPANAKFVLEQLNLHCTKPNVYHTTGNVESNHKV